MSWGRLAVTCFILLQLISPYPLYGSSSVAVTVKQRIVTAQQRGIVTLPFTVVNRGTDALALNENITLPAGWRLLAEKGTFILAPGERALRLVHVLASSHIPAGKYAIPYQVVAKDKFTVRAEAKINVVIHTNSRLVVDTLEKPEFVLAGETYAVKVRAENKGNSPLSLNVGVKDTAGYLVSFEPRQLQLAPSESKIITLESAIPADLNKSLSHALKLSLRGDSVTEDSTINTRIISRTPVGTGLYHTLPTKITAHYTDAADNSTLQAEVTARGSLDEQGEHHIDLLYRDARTNTASSLTGNSEQRITYQYNAFSVHLGDRTFQVAGITDNGFYGRGFEAGYHPAEQNWNIRAFSVEQHPEDNSYSDTDITPEAQGFEIGYQYNDDLELALNVIANNTPDNSQQDELLTGFEVYWDKYSEAEINFSMAKDKDGSAFRFEQGGSLGAFSYDLEVEQADTSFDGRISDVERQSLTGIYHINDKKSYFRANLFHSKSNLSKDLTVSIPEEKNVSLGFGHYFENNIQDSLYTELFVKQTKDQRDSSDPDYSEQGIRVDYNKSITQALGINATVEYAQKNDNRNEGKSDTTRGSLTVAYTPSDKYYVGLNVDSLQTDGQSGHHSGNQLSYGLNASINFNSRQRLTGYWRHSDNGDSSSQNLHASYNHTFQNGMTLGASVSTDLMQDNTSDLNYLLRLSAPFDLPLYKHKNIASVTGKAIEHASRKPIADTVIGIAGQYAVTDENGHYQFKAIREGNYHITADLSRTDYSNYFPEDTKYHSVNLVANQATTHDIIFAPGTGISGQVLNYTEHLSPAARKASIVQDTAIRPDGGIGGLLITLINLEDDTKIHKTLTNASGYFHFNGLKAGQWKIQASDPEDRIKDARLEEAQRTIELKVGEDKKITFKAIPLLKKIKKIGPGSGFSVSGK